MEDEKVIFKNGDESEILPYLQANMLACYNPLMLTETRDSWIRDEGPYLSWHRKQHKHHVHLSSP